MFFCCPAEDDDVVQISNGKFETFNIPVTSSWKCAGACVSQKVLWCICTSQIGEVKAVLGWMLHVKEYGGILLKGPIWRNISHHSAGEKMSSALGMGQMNFLVTLLRVW